jgi:uncharacterized protein (DUF1015 family)
MADLQTFHGLRYNDSIDLTSVLAPPYDVIKGVMRDELIARDEYNIVQIELAARYGEDATDEQYARCAALLQQWRESGVLVRDDAAFYIYEQEFTFRIRVKRKSGAAFWARCDWKNSAKASSRTSTL